MAKTLPRLELAGMPPELAHYLEPRIARLGYLGEFFKCMAHNPEGLLDFQRFTDSSKRALPDKLVELIALTVAGWMGNAYERHQHERLSIKLGFDREWIAAINRGTLDAPIFSNDERVVHAFILRALETRGHDAAPQFDEVVTALAPQAAAAVLMVMGRYVVHGLIVNTLVLAPPVGSIFEKRS